MALSGLMWWIDRWRKSAAFIDMTLEEQGAFRNLLDEAFLREGPLPSDERLLARASGDVTAWPRVRDRVLAKFTLKADGYHNKTLDDVLYQTKRRVKKQKVYRDRKRAKTAGNDVGNEPGNGVGNEPGNEPGNARGNDAGNEPGYLDPDLGRELSKEQESSRHARACVFAGTRLRVSQAQHGVVKRESSLGSARLLALYRGWDADLVSTSEDFDTLAYIKRRALEVARGSSPNTGPTDTSAQEVDWFEECKQLHGGGCGARLRHHNQMLMDAEKARMRA